MSGQAESYVSKADYIARLLRNDYWAKSQSTSIAEAWRWGTLRCRERVKSNVYLVKSKTLRCAVCAPLHC